MRKSNEPEACDLAISTILGADAKAVKAKVDAEIQWNTAEREARGEHKRGRKPKAASGSRRASSGKG